MEKENMEMLKYFFECYFYEQAIFDELNDAIREFRKDERPEQQFKFITELHFIINTGNYAYACKIIKKHGNRTFNTELAEKVIKYLYNKLTDTLTNVTWEDLRGPVKKIVFCPLCTPDIEKATTFSLIHQATIIQNKQQIYICKPCKLVWFAENKIKAANATPYKEFMRTLGLKGLWKELSGVDVL